MRAANSGITHVWAVTTRASHDEITMKQRKIELIVTKGLAKGIVGWEGKKTSLVRFI